MSLRNIIERAMLRRMVLRHTGFRPRDRYAYRRLGEGAVSIRFGDALACLTVAQLAGSLARHPGEAVQFVCRNFSLSDQFPCGDKRLPELQQTAASLALQPDITAALHTRRLAVHRISDDFFEVCPDFRPGLTTGYASGENGGRAMDPSSPSQPATRPASNNPCTRFSARTGLSIRSIFFPSSVANRSPAPTVDATIDTETGRLNDSHSSSPGRDGRCSLTSVSHTDTSAAENTVPAISSTSPQARHLGTFEGEVKSRRRGYDAEGSPLKDWSSLASICVALPGMLAIIVAGLAVFA